MRIDFLSWIEPKSNSSVVGVVWVHGQKTHPTISAVSCESITVDLLPAATPIRDDDGAYGCAPGTVMLDGF